MSAPKIPKRESYWKNKSKRLINGSYKNVMIYTHDDLDGIYSAIAIRNQLEKQGYNILGYGIVNYQDGWTLTTLHKDLINVSVDFASDHPSIDIYIDHHGEAFGKDNTKHSIKTATCSAYEGILLQYGIPSCDNLLLPIDMVDSAKYDYYDVDIKDTLYFEWDRIFKSANPKLTFTGSLNQMLKRSDHATLIETIYNTKEASIYAIYKNLLGFYAGNNIINKTGERKDYIVDGKWRLGQMKQRTRGTGVKTVYMSQKEFMKDHFIGSEKRINLSGQGYQIFGNIAFIPSGTWANGIRARAILQEDMESGIIPKCVDYILLQYGNTLQMVCFDRMDGIGEMDVPVLPDGSKVDNLGTYMSDLLHNFKEHMGYKDPSTFVGSDDDITKAGGHGGIGSISNICYKYIDGDVLNEKFVGVKYIDVFKNKIIKDISNIEWNNLKLSWSTNESSYSKAEPEMDCRVMMVEDIRTEFSQLSKKEEWFKRKNEMSV